MLEIFGICGICFAIFSLGALVASASLTDALTSMRAQLAKHQEYLAQILMKEQREKDKPYFVYDPTTDKRGN